MSRFRPSEDLQPAPIATPAAGGGRIRKAAFQPPLAAAPIAQQGSVAAATSPLHSVALLFALGSVFVTVSFLHEIIGVTLGVRSYLPPVFGLPAFLGLAVCGGLARVFRNSGARLFIAYTAWLILAIPFSTWPGESVSALISYLEVPFLAFLLIGGLIITMRDFRRIVYAIALGGLVNELTAHYLGADAGGGRLGLANAETHMSIGNANDFAAQLILLLPLFWFAVVSKTLPFVVRVVFGLTIPYGLYLILQTGSRGGLVAMAAMYLCMVIITKGTARLAVAVSVPLLAMAIVVAIPGEIVARLRTVFKEGNRTGEAEQSMLGREYLLHRALDFTRQHPIFGVGPGEFSNSEGGEARSQGQQGIWMTAHNSYLQASSEAGIPASLLLILSIVVSVRNSLRIRREAARQNNREMERAAYALLIALVGFSVCAFFLSLAYRFYFPILIGLASALSQVARSELMAAGKTA